MRTLTVQMPSELHSELFKAAKRADRSASLYVRDAIREKLAREPEPAVAEFPETDSKRPSRAAA